MSYVLIIWMMASQGVQPIQHPYSSLSACEQAGAVWEQTVKAYLTASERSAWPRVHHYSCLPHQ